MRACTHRFLAAVANGACEHAPYGLHDHPGGLLAHIMTRPSYLTDTRCVQARTLRHFSGGLVAVE